MRKPIRNRISKTSFILYSEIKMLIREKTIDIDNPYDDDYLTIFRLQCIDESFMHEGIFYWYDFFYDKSYNT